MDIASRIQNLRKFKGISPEELADKIGVSVQEIFNWESKQSTPDIEKIILLSDYFETTTDYLLKGIVLTKENRIVLAIDRLSAVVFTIIATMLNMMGLFWIITILFERNSHAELGFLFMILGTGLFLIGQVIDTKDKVKAKRLFVLHNVWILLFIPMVCCFYISYGLVAIRFASIVPAHLRSGFLFTCVYIAMCVLVDIVVTKKFCARVDKYQTAENKIANK